MFQECGSKETGFGFRQSWAKMLTDPGVLRKAGLLGKPVVGSPHAGGSPSSLPSQEFPQFPADLYPTSLVQNFGMNKTAGL